LEDIFGSYAFVGLHIRSNHVGSSDPACHPAMRGTGDGEKNVLLQRKKLQSAYRKKQRA